MESRRILAGMARENLPEPLQQPYFSLCFDNDAALKDYSALVQTWVKAGRIFEYGDFLLFKEIIFSRLPETAQHRQLLSTLKAARPRQPSNNGAVDLLQMFIAEQLRNTDLFFASADAYLSRQTKSDTRTIDTLVQNAIDTTLSCSPPGHTADKDGAFPSQAARFAARWSAHLVEHHPDKPAYQVNLAISDYLRGNIRNLRERCDELMKGNEAKHRQLERVAGMLFRIGRYELSAGYYKKAMNLRPDIIRYRLDHADCLIQLHRYRQARDIYLRLLTHPGTTRTWDVETLLERLWVCYEKPAMTDRFIDLIETLKTHPSPSLDPNTLREAAGTLLLKKGRFQAAEKQLSERLQNAPTDEGRYGVSLQLATCHAAQNDYEAAIRIYSECLRRYSEDILKTIDCLYNRAEMKRRKGDFQAAIEDWKRIGERFPTDEIAAEAMLTAASVADDSLRDRLQARQLYSACLKLAKPHSPMARMVKEKVAAMGGPE
jgi:tetratricopeptide (TPR) repeat protein